MKRLLSEILVLFLLMVTLQSQGAGFRVGIARKSITPEFPIWLNGYAARQSPSTGKSHDLWAKALVIEENPTSKVIIVTVDVLGLTREITTQVAERVIKKYGINRSQLFLNSSHTHAAPVIWPELSGMFNFTPDELKAVVSYCHKLTDDIVTVIDSAMASLAPMEIECGHGSAGFGANRRGTPITVSDNDVPVIRFLSPDGKTAAILCGYACHNTTLGPDNLLVNGDYAGYAMIELEKVNPGSTAFFVAGCGADQNPAEGGSIELAEQNGKALADAVQKALAGGMHKVRPPLRTSFTLVELQFPPMDLQQYQKDILSDDFYVRNRAKLMLEAYNKWWDMTRFRYPVQAIRFNSDLTILGMGGEVVVDYSLNMKKRYPTENLFVAGYCSEVTCYIPSLRILKEGGYEANSAMIFYAFPGPFADNVEQLVTGGIDKVMKGVGARPSKKK